MSILRTAGKVGTKALYHLTAGAVIRPKASLAFVETLANAVADFESAPSCRLPKITLQELFAGIQTMRLPMTVIPPDDHELPADEYLCMAGLVKALAPRRVFEIGTNRGRTTRLFGEMSPAGAKIYTLDLPPEEMLTGQCFPEARRELIGEAYRKSPVRRKITQLYGNSHTFNFSPYAGRMDLVFIDGDHSYQGVKSDTEHALKMLAPGGVILWDDYIQCDYGIDVMHYLHELAKTKPVRQLHNTRLAFYRRGKR